MGGDAVVGEVEEAEVGGGGEEEVAARVPEGDEGRGRSRGRGSAGAWEEEEGRGGDDEYIVEEAGERGVGVGVGGDGAGEGVVRGGRRRRRWDPCGGGGGGGGAAAAAVVVVVVGGGGSHIWRRVIGVLGTNWVLVTLFGFCSSDKEWRCFPKKPVLTPGVAPCTVWFENKQKVNISKIGIN